MKRDFIRSIYENTEAFAGKEVTLGGWVRNLRDSKASTGGHFFTNSIV